MKPRVGFIGLGVIGTAMAGRLLEKGLQLVVWNRTAEKVESLVSRGAERGRSPREAAQRAEVVITMVTDGPALEQVSLDADGVAAGLTAGKVHCDMSTIDPQTAERMATHYARRGLQFLHAPVLGNNRAAAAGSLLIFAGGPQTAFEKCGPVFAALGQKVWHWDQPQRGTCVKLACNLLLGGMVELLSESLVFVSHAGVNPRTFLEILGASALAAPMYQSKGEAIVARNFKPSFYLRNMLKDLNLAVEAGERLRAELPATKAIRDVFAAAAKQGLAELDYSAVIEWLEGRAGARVEPN